MPGIHPQLPVEIIQSEVLSRLPVKSIGRFRSVCKQWNSLLSTSDFARTHLLRYHTKNKLLVLLDNDHQHQSSSTFRTLDCDPVNHDSITSHSIPFKEDVLILETCDGLVCVALKDTLYLAFWNPLTGAYNKFRTCYYNQVLDSAFVFYCDRASNDYKLVQIVPCEGAFIYSQKLNSWREIPCLEISHHISNFTWSMASLLGNKVYFNLDSILGRPLWCLVSYDLESEKFMEIQFPPSPSPSGSSMLSMSLLAFNGCIHLCVIYENTTMNFDVWKMDGGDAWIKVAAFSRKHLNLPRTFRRAHLRKDGNWLAISEEDNMKSTFKNIDVEDFVTGYMYSCVPWHWHHEHNGTVYMETLMSPNP